MRLAIGLLLLSLSGCSSITSLQRARALGSGHFELGLDPGVVVTSGNVALHESGLAPVAPRADVVARFGVSDRLDLGVRAGTSGAELQSKVELTRPGAGPLHLAVAPSAGVLPFRVAPVSVT